MIYKGWLVNENIRSRNCQTRRIMFIMVKKSWKLSWKRRNYYRFWMK